MITSTRNPKIQLIRALQNKSKTRRDSQSYIVEGVRLTEEAQAAGVFPKEVFFTDDLPDRGKNLVSYWQERNIETTLVAPNVLQALSETQTPQGILAVIPISPTPLPSTPTFLLMLDQIRDPGNMGTILRTAAAAGVEAVILTIGTTDAFAPKVVRAAMGAHFRIPIQNLDWSEIKSYLNSLPANPALQIFLADAAGQTIYTQANFRAPTLLIIGGEAEGAGEEANHLHPIRLNIPMPGKMESLNAGIAGGILMYEVLRQRKHNN